jgi:hypothetical protein
MLPSNIDLDVETLALRKYGFLGCIGPYEAPLFAYSYNELPPEAKHVLELISSGGPFQYPAHDGKFYQNRGADIAGGTYFREFTVPTPSVPHRGKRRLVVSNRGHVYFTACHYDRVQGASPAQRASEMAQMQEEWRHGFYIVTGMNPSLRSRVAAGMASIHSSRLPAIVRTGQ